MSTNGCSASRRCSRHAISCPRWGDDRVGVDCTCGPAPVHRESREPVDLVPIMARIEERRSVVASNKIDDAWRERVDADTDMLEAVVLECLRLRAANRALREVVEAMRGGGK